MLISLTSHSTKCIFHFTCYFHLGGLKQVHFICISYLQIAIRHVTIHLTFLEDKNAEGIPLFL